MPLVHVTGKGRSFEKTAVQEPLSVPTSVDTEYYTDDTRRAEHLLGLPPSAYFYAGRACPDFGNVAFGFAPDCETAHSGSVTPFDSGGLMHPARHIKVRLAPTDGDAERAAYGKASVIPLAGWRERFAQVLAVYFEKLTDYWEGKPQPTDPEGLYDPGNEWRAWAFEVRFHEPHSIEERAAWCADETVMAHLLRLQDEEPLLPPGDPPTPVARFLSGPAALEPNGTPEYIVRIETWAREQVGA